MNTHNLFLWRNDKTYPAIIKRYPYDQATDSDILLELIIHRIDKAIFFYFLVYGSSDPNFCILEKNKKFIFDFFYFLRCKKTARFKKKLNIKKNNKNCMILHFKNAEMTILSFLHFYSVKSFLLFFFSPIQKCFRLN